MSIPQPTRRLPLRPGPRLLVLLPLLTFVLLIPTGAANALTPTEYAGDVHRATNAQRSQRGIAPLRANACVTRFAVRQAERMAAERRIFHQSLSRVLRRCALTRAGENVAYTSRGGAAVVRMWMNSTKHRANILDRRFRLLGVGARYAGGTWYVAQVFGRR